MDLSFVILGMNAEGFANVIFKARRSDIKFDMEYITIVSQGRQATIFFNMDCICLDRQVGSQSSFRTVSLFECQTFGGSLPVPQRRRRFNFFLIKSDKAARVDSPRKFEHVGIRLSLRP